MIKEIFDIEPKQKSALVFFLSFSFISFLQLWLFKREIIDQGVFITIALSMALAIGWIILNLPSLVLFFRLVNDDGKLDEDNRSTALFVCGLCGLGWILSLTYLCYEFQWSLRHLIRLGILTEAVRFIFWLIMVFIENRKSKPKENSTS
jgi:hypothetical protein